MIYRPETERWSHYAEATLARQFDAYVWFDRTTAVTPTSTSGVADPALPPTTAATVTPT